MAVAEREHALQFVVRGAQRAAQSGIANGTQHRRSEARRFIVAERFDRTIRERFERRSLARPADGDQRNVGVASAQFVEELVARSVVERRPDDDDVDGFFG